MNKHKSEIITLSILILLALFIRLFILQTHEVIETDGPYYIYMGENFISGNGFLDIENNLNIILSPLYPITIGIFSLIIKNLELCARIVSILFGILLIIPVYLIAKKFYGKKTGYLSALILAIYPPLGYISTLTYTDSLYLFLLFTGLYLGWLALIKNKNWLFIILGAIFGLAYLTRPEGLFYIILFLIFITITNIKSSKIEVKNIALQMFSLIVGFLIVSSPYLLFLHNSTGEWSLSEKADIVYSYGEKEQPQYSLEYEKEHFSLSDDKKSLNFNPYDSQAQKGILSQIILEPKNTVYRYIKNFYLENTKYLPLLFPIPFLIIIILGIFGINWNKESYKKELYLISLLIYPLLLYPLFWVEERYLIPITPILIIWLAKGSLELKGWIKKSLKEIKIYNRLPVYISITIIIIMLLSLFVGNLFITNVLNDKYEKSDPPIEQKIAGLWLKENKINENIIVMARKPWVSFYSNSLFSIIPYANYLEMIDYAKLKKVDYIVIDGRYISKLRPQLAFLLEETPKELELVYEDKESKYEVRIYKLKTFLKE